MGSGGERGGLVVFCGGKAKVCLLMEEMIEFVLSGAPRRLLSPPVSWLRQQIGSSASPVNTTRSSLSRQGSFANALFDCFVFFTLFAAFSDLILLLGFSFLLPSSSITCLESSRLPSSSNTVNKLFFFLPPSLPVKESLSTRLPPTRGRPVGERLPSHYSSSKVLPP